MAIGIRLTRKGKINKPSYAIIVADTRKRRDGAYIERIGTYDPRSKDKKVVLNKEKALYWLKQGPRVSDTVRSIFRKEGLLRK